MVLDELLDEAPVTWARSYGGPLLPPMMLSEPITDFPLDIPVQGAELKVRPRVEQSDVWRRPSVTPGSELDRELGCGT